ncbi:type VI secretion protein [Bradyrhizobium sp. CB1015]|uniref:type VI secretion protein n=1 Tax=Bradyrhizobium sp. CB1015 TaxID=2976822 RepID=UPI0021A99A9F|nr:type VI secretion protein [Bradyrhizobium sp. CB1015]UWU90984.1 type VI secretion protein [Bradyrhizobium sp. CB1015]
MSDEMIRVNVARKDAWIATLLIAAALGVFAQSALAAESDCRAIEGTVARLACYDAAFPPKTAKPAIPDNDASRAAYNDPLIAEDARIVAKLKNICRGC